MYKTKVIDLEKVRKDFPILERKIHGKDLVYFDNAATTQKPLQVIEAIKEYYSSYNANIHRGLHQLSEEATQAYEESHKVVGEFIGAKWEEIVFTRNATESLNLAANVLVKGLKKGDKIVITQMEHHSNLVPWQQIALEKGLDLEFLEVNEEGILGEGIEEKIEEAKIVSVTNCSNVLGTINDVKRIGKQAHKQGAFFVVDGAQSVPHMKVDVREIDADFFAFSGHKMLGPTGIGALYGKKSILEEMPPFLYGGDMINEVWFEKSTWNELPWKYEAGTPNICGGIGLKAAVEYLQKIGMENLREHEKSLTKYALEKMQEIKGLTTYGTKDLEKRGGVISFNIEGIHPHDITTVLDQYGIATRGGNHCAQPLMRHMNIVGTARASFYLYNTFKEIDYFAEVLEKAKKMMG